MASFIRDSNELRPALGERLRRNVALLPSQLFRHPCAVMPLEVELPL